MLLANIFQAASMFLNIVEWCIIIYALSTWIAPRSSLRFWLEKFIYPFCAPFQALSYKIRQRWGSPIDLTCLFALIALQIINRLLWVLYSFLLRFFF